ncbi:hypothetical protein GCM10027174_09100 [Salinifilum aidingensis]
MGGEWGGAVLIATEYAPPGKKILCGAFAQQGSPVGNLLATLAFVAIAWLPDEAFMSWGWRLPFLASAVLVFVGLFIRLRLDETPEMQQVLDSKRESTLPIKEVLGRYPLLVALGVGAGVAGVSITYVKTTFALSWATTELDFTRSSFLAVIAIALVVQVLVQPLGAVLASRINLKRAILAMLLPEIVLLPVMFVLINTGSLLWASIGMAVATFPHAMYYSAMAGLLSQVFPVGVRYTGMSLCYQLCTSLFAGTAPVIAQFLLARTGSIWPVVALGAGYVALTVLCVFALIRRSSWNQMAPAARPVPAGSPLVELIGGHRMNFAERDPALPRLLDRVLSREDRARIGPVLTEIGALAAGELDELAATADANPPRLRQYGPGGERIDEVDFHPAYTRMMRMAFERFGLAAMSHRAGVLGWPTTVPHTVKYALSYVFVQAEFGLACPLSMTDSAARVLRMFDPETFAAEIAALSSPDVDDLATGAMFMTEKQGGTDIARTSTEATDHGTHWTLRGHKWFASNVSADVVLTLARVPGQGEGTRGLGMFLVPRLRPDGSRNSYRIDRLKDKLGARSMASGEVTLDDAYARPVGTLTQGFHQMAEMLNVSRLSNAMRSAALMRRAVLESVEHTRQRVVFGTRLFDQPLMRATLLPMLLDAEAALGLVLESAARLDEADAGDAEARRLVRVLTPLAKYTVCKQARSVTGEAMEIRGGNGYIEDWVNPRLVRDAHLGSIWEGSSNVIALDVLRCVRQDSAHHLLADTYLQRLRAIDAAQLKTAVHTAIQRWEDLRLEGEQLLAHPRQHQQARIADYAEALARAVMAALLLEQAAHDTAVGHGQRTAVVAAAYVERLLGASTTPAHERALAYLDELVDGSDVPPAE